ncbi:MAG TPA: carbon-nitrogen hydrolase family protein, partial [Steroidobacteraceae bacterium]
ARVALLPENFSFMGVRDVDKRAVAEPDGDGPVQRFLSQQARELGLWIVGGTTPIAQQAGERVAAACLVYADDGRRVARYDKMHLFDVDIPGKTESYRESKNTAPGARAVLVPTPAGLLGLSVCYDMRFPELYRQMCAAGAQWFTMPSAFTVPTGRAHWETLLRARAIENLSYVVAAAQWGRHASGRDTYGDSLVVDYWGTVLARLGAGVGVLIAELDLAAQAEARRNFPALTHRLM